MRCGGTLNTRVSSPASDTEDGNDAEPDVEPDAEPDAEPEVEEEVWPPISNTGVLSWVTQLGTATHAVSNPASVNQASERCYGIAADSSGNVYCAGSTDGNLSELNGGQDDAFVMKLNSSGAIQWVTQLGAATLAPSNPASANQGAEQCNGVAVDSGGNVYCAGYTQGNVAEGNAGGQDAFVMKLDSFGVIQWVTQLGAATHAASNPANVNQGHDSCNGVAVDSSGNVYCAGSTTGNLSEVNAGNTDSFVLKLNSSGVIQWVTQLGASTHSSHNPASVNQGNDMCYGVAVDSNGNVYCAGQTSGNLDEINGGGNDAFAMKLNSSGVIQWLTQLGAATVAPSNPASPNQGNDQCNGVAVDSNGNVYCAGATYGNLAEVRAAGGADSFVMKLNSSGGILWATQLGTTTQVASPPASVNQGVDYCSGVAVDHDGGVYCAGVAFGNLGEVYGAAFQADSFAMKLSSDGVLQWLTQLGSVTKAASNPASANEGYDQSYGVAVDRDGKVYFGGFTSGNVGEVNAGNVDILIHQLN